MLCGYSVGNDLVILYSASLIHLRRRLDLGLGPGHRKRAAMFYFLEMLDFIFILSMITNLEIFPSSLLRHLSEFRFVFFSKIMYIWRCSSARSDSLLLYYVATIPQHTVWICVKYNIITSNKFEVKVSFLEVDSEHFKASSCQGCRDY